MSLTKLIEQCVNDLEEAPLEEPKFDDLGVKKVFILAIVAKTPENYENMKTIIQKTKLNTLQNYIMVADLKLGDSQFKIPLSLWRVL